MHFEIITLKLNEMIDLHSKYDNMHKNGIFYTLICIKKPIISCVNCMLLVKSYKEEILLFSDRMNTPRG